MNAPVNMLDVATRLQGSSAGKPASGGSSLPGLADLFASLLAQAQQSAGNGSGAALAGLPAGLGAAASGAKAALTNSDLLLPLALSEEDMKALQDLLQAVADTLEGEDASLPDGLAAAVDDLLAQLAALAETPNPAAPAMVNGGQDLPDVLAELTTALRAAANAAEDGTGAGGLQALAERAEALLTRLSANPEPAPQASIFSRLVGGDDKTFPTGPSLARPDAAALEAGAAAQKQAPSAAGAAAGDQRALPSAGAAAASALAAVSAEASGTPDDAPIDPLLLAQSGAGPNRADFSPAMRPATAAYQAAQPHLNMPHIAFEIVRHIRDGFSRFEIRLDPPEMGRIDVRLDMDGAGGINARMVVERQETLDLLQRDSRALERALAQAGLDGAKTNLEFSLKQNPFAQRDDGQDHHWRASADDAATDDAAAALPAAIHYRATGSPGGVNLWA